MGLIMTGTLKRTVMWVINRKQTLKIPIAKYGDLEYRSIGEQITTMLYENGEIAVNNLPKYYEILMNGVRVT